jgi:hypothetical protein
MSFQAVFNYSKPKYSVLNDLIGGWMPSVDIVRIFFDIDAFTAVLFNPRNVDFMRELMSERKMYAASEIINIAAHYRHYFWSRYNVPTDIIMNYTLEPIDSGEEGYLKQHYDKRLGITPEYKRLSNYTSGCVRLASKICEFIPNVHVINTKTMDPHTLPNVVMNQITPGDDSSMNLVVSNKKHMIMYGLNHNCAVMTYRGDNTQIVTSDNMNETVSSKYNIGVPPHFYPIIIAISGDVTVGMKPVRARYSAIKSMKMIKKMLEDKVITKNTYDIDSFLDRVDVFTSEEKERIAKRFEYINIRKSASQLDLANIESQIINKYDWDSLLSLNARYFEEYPINLEYTVDGEKYE